ncbi:FadR/GntR family transcriptional regulator [Agromyces mariniharenae]|uniref:FadR family transcriptional regulator n=1 Tax=Agromyces mariniharenae TaxID=2604423 RepID=A0A5S4V2B4_9MICO|nr:FCD domain-containing protein [Agromyces mariniharenae]TYL53274.1 FadR family transcriptional regulator [Agromyces mariniharenae]
MDASLSSSSALHEQVLESLGADIVAGRLPPGTRVLTADVAERFGASRAALREVVRVLESMGLVEVRRRAGVEILPPARWNPYATRLIRWRLAGADRIGVLHQLSQLRSVVEPLAARLAASAATSEQRAALVGAVMGMVEHARHADEGTYLEHDIAFHAAVLDASCNPFLAALGEVIGEVLRGRTQHALMPAEANPVALRLHQDVASYIAEGRPEEAERAMAAIVAEADEAVQQLRPSSASVEATHALNSPVNTGEAPRTLR